MQPKTLVYPITGALSPNVSANSSPQLLDGGQAEVGCGHHASLTTQPLWHELQAAWLVAWASCCGHDRQPLPLSQQALRVCH
jgi:hypothetical protein